MMNSKRQKFVRSPRNLFDGAVAVELFFEAVR